jgi:hypothetical protein
MGKKSRSGSRMNITDHISEILETIFGLKILKKILLGSGSGDPGTGMVIRIRDKHPRSAKLDATLPR